MTEIKNVLLKVFALAVDIFLLSFQTIKQLVLPNCKRKGNLLSSVVIFFVGIIDRLNSFEHGFFNMATLFKKIRKASYFIMGGILLLSSFECKILKEHFKESHTLKGAQELKTKMEAKIKVSVNSFGVYPAEEGELIEP